MNAAMSEAEAQEVRQRVVDYGPTQCAELNLMVRIEQTIAALDRAIGRIERRG